MNKLFLIIFKDYTDNDNLRIHDIRKISCVVLGFPKTLAKKDYKRMPKG